MSTEMFDDRIKKTKSLSENPDIFSMEQESIDDLDDITETALSSVKKNKRKKIRKISPKKLFKIKNDSEYKLLIENLKSIEHRINEMDIALESSVKWISNVCIIIILGMVVLVLTIASIAITIISKFV